MVTFLPRRSGLSTRLRASRTSPAGSCTEMHEALSRVEERGPSKRQVLDENGASKEAEDEVRSPPTI